MVDNFARRGWEVDESRDDLVVLWASVPSARTVFAPGSGIRFGEGMSINHFPNSVELVRKDLLVKNIKRYRRTLAGSGVLCPEIVPQTYYLPQVRATRIHRNRLPLA